MRLFEENVGHWGIYVLKQGNPWQNFKNHLQLPNICILLSFFASLSHHFMFHRVDIWLYWYFLINGWGSLKKASDTKEAKSRNREIPGIILNLLIKLWFSCFIFLCFSFLYQKFYQRWDLCLCEGKYVSTVEEYTAWNRGVCCNQFTIVMICLFLGIVLALSSDFH